MHPLARKHKKLSQPEHDTKNPRVYYSWIAPGQQRSTIRKILNGNTIQPKLTIGEPGAQYEQEADRVADQVMHIPDTPIKRQQEPEEPEEEPDEEQEQIQSKPVSETVSPLLQRVESQGEKQGQELQTNIAEDQTVTAWGTSKSSIILEDDINDRVPGQISRSEFLNQIEQKVYYTVETSLQDSGWSCDNCPALLKIFTLIKLKSAGELEQFLNKYLPETKSADSAADLFTMITYAVNEKVAAWLNNEPVPAIAGIEVPTQVEFANGMAPEIQFKKQSGPVSGFSPLAVRARMGTGRILDNGPRVQMEKAFNHGFSNVTVHTDSNTGSIARRLGARAFTIGDNIGFAPGEYKPGTPVGDALLAHELAHTLQQKKMEAGGEVFSKNDAEENSILEKDADNSAVGAVAMIWGKFKGQISNIPEIVLPRLKTGLKLQRCDGCDSPDNKGPTPPVFDDKVYDEIKKLEEEIIQVNNNAIKSYGQINDESSKADLDDPLKKLDEYEKQAEIIYGKVTTHSHYGEIVTGDGIGVDAVIKDNNDENRNTAIVNSRSFKTDYGGYKEKYALSLLNIQKMRISINSKKVAADLVYKIVTTPKDKFDEKSLAYAELYNIEQDIDILDKGEGKYTGSESGETGKEKTDCITFVLDIFKKTYGGSADKKVISAFKSVPDGKGTELAKKLVKNAGWKSVFFARDKSDRTSEEIAIITTLQDNHKLYLENFERKFDLTSVKATLAKLPAGNKLAEDILKLPDDEIKDSVKAILKKQSAYYKIFLASRKKNPHYEDIPVHHKMIDYANDPAKKKQYQKDIIDKIALGFIATTGGLHTAMLLGGKVYEVHWDKKSDSSNLIDETSGFFEWNQLAPHGIIVTPDLK